MKMIVALLALAFACTTGTALAAEETKKAPSAAQKAQQDKMKSCNADAGEKQLKGSDRKAFMKECLGAKPAQATQQSKMKTCNVEAGEKQLKGSDRKKFMSDCLKADKQ